MTSDPSQRPVNPLRARMIEDMTVHGFNERTSGHYVRHVRAFAAFIGRSPDTATAGELHLFQLHQTRSGVQPPSRRGGSRCRQTPKVGSHSAPMGIPPRSRIRNWPS